MSAVVDRALRKRLDDALRALAQIVVGKNEVIHLAMAALLARGHVLLEDLPGSGKTTLAKAFAKVLDLPFRRVQFTSDLLPADVIGFSLFHEESQRLRFKKGPIFTHLLLADEINRASPKSQSALLEAMEERQVTVDHHTHALPDPFFVIATQNPLEQVGTYALPEAQLDRFLMRLSLGYLASDLEVGVLRGDSGAERLEAQGALLSQADVLALQRAVRAVVVSNSLAQYVQRLLHYTRDGSRFRYGLSTRSGIGMVRAAQAMALLHGREAVFPSDVQAVFKVVAWHRLHYSGDVERHEMALQGVLDAVEVPL